MYYDFMRKKSFNPGNSPPHCLFPPFSMALHRTEIPPSPFDQIWRQGDKNLNFQTFQWIGENLEMQSRLFKNPNFPSLLWIEKNLEIYTVPDQRFKIQMLNLWMSWESLCPNLSFTVENKMGNSHKRGWSHFKLNINDWLIPFAKILRICQCIGFNEFVNVHSKLQNFDLLPLVHSCSFYMEDAYGFLNEKLIIFL